MTGSKSCVKMNQDFRGKPAEADLPKPDWPKVGEKAFCAVRRSFLRRVPCSVDSCCHSELETLQVVPREGIVGFDADGRFDRKRSITCENRRII